MNEKFIKELWKLVRENTQGIKELRESQKETDRQIKELRESQKEINRLFKKTDREIEKINKQLSEKIEKLGIEVGKLTDGWGKFTHGLSLPSITEALKESGYEILGDVEESLKIKINGKVVREIDFLIFARKDGQDYVIIGEAKTSVSSKHIDKLVNEVLPAFGQYYTHLKKAKKIGLISGIRLGKGVERYANRKGVFILAPAGGVLKIRNSRNFKPREFD